jgi:hypothetical protein
VNSSRGIIYASSNPEDFDVEAQKAAKLLRDQLNDALHSDRISPQSLTID